MLKARQVLADCRKAHSLLDCESDPQNFRILFTAAVSLCRAVGHVLSKIDAAENPSIARQIEGLWKEVKTQREKHRIFHDFIERQRNLVLKEYEFLHVDSPQTVTIPSGEAFVLDDLLFCPVSDGEYAGVDCRDLLAEAIEWWETMLNVIES